MGSSSTKEQTTDENSKLSSELSLTLIPDYDAFFKKASEVLDKAENNRQEILKYEKEVWTASGVAELEESNFLDVTKVLFWAISAGNEGEIAKGCVIKSKFPFVDVFSLNIDEDALSLYHKICNYIKTLFINLDKLKDNEQHLQDLIEVSSKLIADIKKNARAAGLNQDQTVKATSTLLSNIKSLKFQKEILSNVVLSISDKYDFIAGNMEKIKLLYIEADKIGKQACQEKRFKPFDIYKRYHPKSKGKWRYTCGCA